MINDNKKELPMMKWRKKIQLNLRYLKVDEVQKVRNRVTNFKANFLAKLQMLKYKGQLLEVLSVIEDWLNNNIDYIYELDFKKADRVLKDDVKERYCDK